MHGQGSFYWSNEDLYEGTFVDGQRTGRGVFQWESGERYEGEFRDGLLEGSGRFTYPDGREYAGRFDAGKKQGDGVYRWPNGNRYVGDFTADERSGLGVFYWRDGTIYRGRFEDNRMHGYGIKQQPEGEMEVQLWQSGQLKLNKPVVALERCRLIIDEIEWMFEDEGCINGLAHGKGLATRIDGAELIVDGHFVLGRYVSGDRQPLVQDVAN